MSSSFLRLRSTPPKVLNVKEASVYLNVSERKLREEIALGNIKVARLGRRILLRLSDLDEFVASLTV